MCNCIELQRKAILKDKEVAHVVIQLSTIKSIKNGKFVGPDKTAQPVDIGWKRTKRNGDKVVKNERTFVTHIFCPWCGVKYD